MLRKALIAFFLSLMWAKVAWFLAETNVFKIPLGLILIPISFTSSFLAYHLYVNPYNETK